MALFSRNIKKADEVKASHETPVITIDSVHRGLDYLVELVKQIRPVPYTNYKQADLKFKALFYQLQNNKTALFSLRKAMLSQFLKSNFIPALTESGMVGSRGFLQELITKIKHKLLPPLLETNNFLYVINHVFYKANDYVWIEKIDKSLWINFFQLLGIQISVKDKGVLRQLHISLQVLSHRTVTLGLEKEVMNNLPDLQFDKNPFLLLNQAIQDYLNMHENNEDNPHVSPSVLKIVDAINGCKKTIADISEQRRIKGTSLSQTYILIRIEQHLERLLLITDILDKDKKFNTDRFLDYFIKVILYEKKRVVCVLS